MSEAPQGDAAAAQTAHARLRAAWDANGGVSVPERRDALARLRAAVKRRAEPFAAALDKDFGGRSRQETLVAEVSAVLRAVDHARSRLARWAAPERVAVGFPFWPARGVIQKQPLGVVGIIGPSNFPVQLTLLPLVGAVAAGCRVLLKPSELTPATAELLAETIAEAFGPDLVAVVTGDAAAAVAVTHLPLDHLLFTGSGANGRKVLAATAETMVPVTLELGGKSPVVLARDADLAQAARAVMAGKLMNAGQTCVAPDYVLVPRPQLEPFVAAAQAAARSLYPDPEALAAIRSEKARLRLGALRAGLDGRPLLSGAVAPGQVEPALLIDPPLDHAVMHEEIFGPLLPIVPYDALDDAVAVINARPHPLALYWFGRDRAMLDALLARTASGTVAVNETVLHAAVEALPFGGIGASGRGAYHGRAGFDTFSHRRPVFFQSRFSLTRLLRPPYESRAERIIAGMLR